jgi:hypothetical protein
MTTRRSRKLKIEVAVGFVIILTTLRVLSMLVSINIFFGHQNNRHLFGLIHPADSLLALLISTEEIINIDPK